MPVHEEHVPAVAVPMVQGYRVEFRGNSGAGIRSSDAVGEVGDLIAFVGEDDVIVVAVVLEQEHRPDRVVNGVNALVVPNRDSRVIRPDSLQVHHLLLACGAHKQPVLPVLDEEVAPALNITPVSELFVL